MHLPKHARARRLASAGLLVAALAACTTPPPAPQSFPAEAAPVKSPEDRAMRARAAEVFTYGYPLVLMDVTREAMTAHAAPNVFTHRRTFPEQPVADVVSPDVDTLASTAWVDLSEGPVVLSVPDTAGRYYVMSMMDAWTNVFAAPGKRTTGTRRGTFAIVGPDWRGTLPKGMQEIRSPTSMVWVLGRTQAYGKQDFAAVHRLQDQYRLVPLSDWQRGARAPLPRPVASAPAVQAHMSPSELVAAMDAQAFFSRLALLLKANPPAPADAAMVEQMRQMGLEAGMPFKTTVLEPATARALQEGATTALAAIGAAARQGSADAGNGWVLHRDLGRYGTDYGRRAATAWVGLGASLPEDSLYATTRFDARGRPLEGSGRYVLHFPKGQLPPARAFWSVTLYNDRQTFASNALGRYAVSSRDRLRYNRDGSLDIYIQYEKPTNVPQANWLPAPANALNLMLRAYWPEQALLDGSWMPPAVERVEEARAQARL